MLCGPRVPDTFYFPLFFSPQANSMTLAEEMTLAEDKVRETLKQVIDPELYINIVDLGLVYVVDVKEPNEDGRHDVHIEMTLTSPMCPAGPQLVAGAKNAAESLEEVNEAKVQVVMDPPWSQDMMTEEARDQLGIF